MRPFVAFDTATDHLALAVGDLDTPGVVVAAGDFPAPRAANTVLLLAIERLLSEAGVEARSLAAVACGRGPGSFTGVRIGVATGKGLAHGLGVPLVGFSTLDAVAHRADTEGLLGVVGDAMRGEVYPMLYRVCGDVLTRLETDRVASPTSVAHEWAALGEPITLTGPALGKHRAVFEAELGDRGRLTEPARWTPDGHALVAAAWMDEGPRSVRSIAGLDAAAGFAAAHPGALLPVYTRLSDAEEAERAGARGAATPPSGVAGPNRGEAS